MWADIDIYIYVIGSNQLDTNGPMGARISKSTGLLGWEVSRMGSKHDGIEARRENPKLGENPNFGITKFFEEARGSGNIFEGYQTSSVVY